MSTRDPAINAEEADQLLSGHLPTGRDDLARIATELAGLSAAFVQELDPQVVRNWASTAAGHAHLIPSDKGDPAATSASNADRPAPQVSGLPKRRSTMLKPILAVMATTAGKVAMAGAVAAASVTGGLAATGNLPGQSDAKDKITTISDDSDPSADPEGEDDVTSDDGITDAVTDDCGDEAAEPAGGDEANDTDEADEADEAPCQGEQEPAVADNDTVTPAPAADDDLSDEAEDQSDDHESVDHDVESDDEGSNGEIESDDQGPDDEIESDDSAGEGDDEADDSSPDDGGEGAGGSGR